jgi:hypothetical protein
MSNKTDFQAKNTRLNANNTDLSSILETINNLPEAGSGGGSGKLYTGGTIFWFDMGGVHETIFAGSLEEGKNYEIVYANAFEGVETTYASFTTTTVPSPYGIDCIGCIDETIEVYDLTQLFASMGMNCGMIDVKLKVNFDFSSIDFMTMWYIREV